MTMYKDLNLSTEAEVFLHVRKGHGIYRKFGALDLQIYRKCGAFGK